MKSLLNIHGAVVESHKFAHPFSKIHAQLREIYVIVYKLHKIREKLRDSQQTKTKFT